MKTTKTFTFVNLICWLFAGFAGSPLKPVFAQFSKPPSIDQKYFPNWAKTTRVVPFWETTLLDPIYLVQSKAVARRKEISDNPSRTGMITDFVITKVYTGPQTLKGRKWSQYPFYGGSTSGAFDFWTTAELGQEVLCPLELGPNFKDHPNPPGLGKIADDQYVLLLSGIHGGYELGRMIVLDETPLAQAFLLHAQAIARAYNCPSAELEPLIISYAKEKTVLTPTWATYLLVHWNRPSTHALLKELARDGSRSVKQLITLDDLLLTLQRENWRTSPIRLALLTDLSIRNLTEEESRSVASHFSILAQHPQELTPPVVLNLLLNFIQNRSISYQSKISAVGSPGWMVRRETLSHEEAFMFWNGILLDREHLNVAWVASSALSEMKPLSQYQKQRLELTVTQIEKWLPWITNQATTKAQSVDAALDQLRLLLK